MVSKIPQDVIRVPQKPIRDHQDWASELLNILGNLLQAMKARQYKMGVFPVFSVELLLSAETDHENVPLNEHLIDFNSTS